MRIEPLYRATFTTPESWHVELHGEHGAEEQGFLIAEGRTEGRLTGRLRASNFPRVPGGPPAPRRPTSEV